MGFVSSLSFKKVSISVYNYTQTDDGYGNISKGYSATADYSSDLAIVYEGSQAERIVSERLKTEIYAVVLIDWFSGYESKIREKDKIIIGSKELSVIAVENIGSQNQVLQIPVKEF